MKFEEGLESDDDDEEEECDEPVSLDGGLRRLTWPKQPILGDVGSVAVYSAGLWFFFFFFLLLEEGFVRGEESLVGGGLKHHAGLREVALWLQGWILMAIV